MSSNETGPPLNLVLHIGLHKSGTSTIQERLFAGRDNYLGRSGDNRCLSGSLREVHDLQRVVGVRRRTRGTDTSGREWARRVRDLHAASGIKRDTLILSDEGLSRTGLLADGGFPFVGWPFSRRSARFDRDAPVLSFLERFARDVWQPGAVRVLLTVRSQPAYLASQYAQLSNWIPRASQADFERQVRALIDSGDGYIDWSAWVERLWSAVGPENTCVLPLEAMDSAEYWRTLLAFTGLEADVQGERMTDPATARNRRSEAASTWRLRPLRNIAAEVVRTRQVLEPWPAARRTLRGGLRLAAPLLDGPLSRALGRGRGTTINLSPELDAEIRAYCRPFNQRLAAQIDRDLGALGYL